MGWLKKDPTLLVSTEKELAERYPDLRFIVVDDVVLLNGSFPIISDGVELDRFQVRICVLPSFPEVLPHVKETGFRIPDSVDWHKFSDGSLCLMVPEEWLLTPNPNSLVAYLDGPLRNFFINHALAEAGQPRPMGERSHGSRGLLEAYGEMVGTTDARAIPRFLDAVSAKRVRSHWNCPCGSASRLQDCHGMQIAALRDRIPRHVAKRAADRLRAAQAREFAAAAKRRAAQAARAAASAGSTGSTPPVEVVGKSA